MPGKDYYAAHREELIAQNREYYAAHREECNANWRAYYARHREERNAAQRAYKKTDTGYALGRASVNRARARARGALIDPDLTTATLAGILRDRESCEWCKNHVVLHDRRIDHVRAIAFGGQHTESNIQVLCLPCDKQKSAAETSLASKLRNGATQSDFALAA